MFCKVAVLSMCCSPEHAKLNVLHRVKCFSTLSIELIHVGSLIEMNKNQDVFHQANEPQEEMKELPPAKVCATFAC